MLRKLFLRCALLLGALLLSIQLVPYGHEHANPPVVREPDWDSPATRALAERACFDCHSNQTRWPWYASVAPVSWLVQRDVAAGRRRLNFSEWDRPQRAAHEASEATLEGEMPLEAYLWMHAEARLDATQRQQLAAGLARSLGASQDGRSSRGERHEPGSR